MSSHHLLSPRKSCSNQSQPDIRRHEHSCNSVISGVSTSSEISGSHNSEPEIIEDKPPSPLSLQQDGVFSLVQSPPFENDQLDSVSPENLLLNLLIDANNQTLINLSEIDSTVADQKRELAPITNVRNPDLQNMTPSERANSVSGDISNPNCPDVVKSFRKPKYSLRDSVSQQPITDYISASTIGSSDPVFSLTTRETNLSLIASRKSVKELYGQPSWWGDGDSDYSYPHTSSFGNKETVHPVIASRKYSMKTDINLTSKENSTRPPAEAFVIDFSSSKPRLERPASISGSLSQCVPLKLRQGLDERERRKKEKQLEVRKQSTSGIVNKNTVATMSNSKSSTTTIQSKTNMNEIQKIRSRGASLSAKGSTVRTSNTTSNVTATTTTTSGRSSSTTINKKPQVIVTKLDKRITSKPDPSLRTGRIDCTTNLTSSSTNASRSNLTDRSRGRLFNQTNIKGPTQSNRTNVKPPFSIGGRRISAGAASLTSQRTAPSQLNRSKVSVVTRGSVHLSTTGLTDSRSNLRGASSATRQSTVQYRGVNRSFMTPTTSSDAKQVKTRESIRSMPNESPISSSPKCDSRRTYESPIGNSAKKPITSTFLRRGTTQGRVGIYRKLSTDNINQYSNTNKSSLCVSDRIASVVSTIEAYDDPKAYLFYRMFQGVEEIETTTTDGIFQAFSPYSSIDFQKHFSSESNDTNEQLDYHLHGYGINEKFQNFQTNSNVQNKFSGLLSIDDEETPYHDLPSHRSDLTTTSTSNSRTLATKTPMYLSKCYTNEIPTDQAQNIVKSSTVSNNKINCTIHENDDATMDPTLKSMNLSMFVSTSVISLTPSQTGTYVIDGGDGIDDDNEDNINNTNQDFLQHSDEQNIHLSKDNDLLTPRGSPIGDITAAGKVLNRQSTDRLSNNQQTKQLQQFAKDFENSMLSVEHVQTHTAHHQYSGNKRLNDSISTVDLTKTSSIEKPLCITSSTVCLTETHANTLQDSKNKKDVLSRAIDNLEDSDHVGTSLTSLTPSHTGTYILDIDDTLIAQGVLPVIIRSHETLASSVNTIDSGLNVESAMNTHGVIVENITPRGSPISKEKLWHIVENDNDDEGRDNDLMLVTSNQSGRSYNIPFDNCDNELTGQFTIESLRAEFEDTYKLLPSPNQFVDGTDSSGNSMNIVESSIPQSESHRSQMKTTNTHSVQGKESNQTIPLVNPSNFTLQHINYFVKPKSINCTEVLVSNNLQNDLITKQSTIHNTYTHNNEKYSSVHIPLNDGVSLPTTISLKLPDSSSSNSSSSNNTSTSSSCSNHILKYNRELTDELDINNQNIKRFDLMHNLNNENNNNMNEHHHSAYNTYIKRRNSENYEHSKLLYNNNNNNAIPSTTGNQLFNVSETIGNHCHITISKRRDNATITNLQSINNNSNCTKITSTTPFSSSFRDPNTMNQLLTRLNSLPTTHYSRPDQSRNIIRTHSCSRGKSRYYSHGSASVPDPASPVRSWSSISSGTEHSLTNRIVCKSRKQLNDQTDSGFIETSYLMKTLNTNKPLPQNSSSTYLGKKSDHFHNSYDDNRTTNLSQYNEDIKSKKSNEIDSRTYTRRKHSRSNDQNDPQKYLTTLDAESYQTWVARMSELAQGLNSLAKEPLFQSDGSCSEENKNEFEPINRLYPDVRTINLPLINDNTQTMPTLPDSTTDPGLSEIVECSAFTTPLPHHTLETMLSVTPENLSNFQKLSQTILNRNNTKKVYLPIIQNGTDEKFTDFILSSQSFQLNPNFDPDSSDPNESAIYYSLMVDTIRYLSIKLRQFSDKLAYRLSHNQQTNASGSNTTELSSGFISTQQNRDDVQSSTKYALHDTFENMKAVNQQLQVVGKLLFSKNNDNTMNELNQIDNATSCEYLHKLEQFNQELYRFIPIEPANIHHNHNNINTSTTTDKFIHIPNTNLQSVLTHEQQLNVGSKSTNVSTNQVMMNTTSALNTQFTTDDNTNSITISNNSTSTHLSHPFTSMTTTTTTTITTVHSSNIHVISLTEKSNDMINKQELLEDEYY